MGVGAGVGWIIDFKYITFDTLRKHFINTKCSIGKHFVNTKLYWENIMGERAGVGWIRRKLI